MHKLTDSNAQVWLGPMCATNIRVTEGTAMKPKEKPRINNSPGAAELSYVLIHLLVWNKCEVRCANMIRKVQFSLRVWICLTITKEIPRNENEKPKSGEIQGLLFLQTGWRRLKNTSGNYMFGTLWASCGRTLMTCWGNSIKNLPGLSKNLQNSSETKKNKQANMIEKYIRNMVLGFCISFYFLLDLWRIWRVMFGGCFGAF